MPREELSSEELLALEADLEQLEATNPDVKQAADNYHRTVERLNRKGRQ